MPHRCLSSDIVDWDTYTPLVGYGNNRGMDNVTVSSFEIFRDWSSWVVAMLAVLTGVIFAVGRWQYYRSPWEMDFRIAKYPEAGKKPEYQLARSEVDMPTGKYMLHITLMCHSMTRLDKANANLVIGARPTTRTVIRQALESRQKARQLKIWPSYTGWKHTISPRVDPHGIGHPPQIGNITTNIEGATPTATTLTPILMDASTWRLSYDPQYDVAIGRAIHLYLELEAEHTWNGALEFSGDIVKGDGQKVYRYVSRKLVFR